MVHFEKTKIKAKFGFSGWLEFLDFYIKSKNPSHPENPSSNYKKWSQID
jgi:hypothetical protein